MDVGYPLCREDDGQLFDGRAIDVSGGKVTPGKSRKHSHQCLDVTCTVEVGVGVDNTSQVLDEVTRPFCELGRNNKAFVRGLLVQDTGASSLERADLLSLRQG